MSTIDLPIRRFARLLVVVSIISYLNYCGLLLFNYFNRDSLFTSVAQSNIVRHPWHVGYLIAVMLLVEIIMLIPPLPSQLKFLFSVWWSWCLFSTLQLLFFYSAVSAQVTIALGLITQIVVVALYLSLAKSLQKASSLDR